MLSGCIRRTSNELYYPVSLYHHGFIVATCKTQMNFKQLISLHSVVPNTPTQHKQIS